MLCTKTLLKVSVLLYKLKSFWALVPKREHTKVLDNVFLRFGEPYSGLDEYSGPGGDICPTPPSAKTHVFVKLIDFSQNPKLFLMKFPIF